MGWSNATGWSGGTGGWNRAAGGGLLYTYNFVSSPSLPATLSLSRASVGTRMKSDGTFATEAIDVARFDYKYNGSTWVNGGLLLEEQRTNLVSSDLHSGLPDGWFSTLSDVSVAYAPGPTGRRRTETATNASGQWWHNQPSASGSAPGIVSTYAKEDPGSLHKPYLGICVKSSVGRAVFDLSGATVTEKDSGATGLVIDIGNSFRRCIAVGPTNEVEFALFAENIISAPIAGGADSLGRLYGGNDGASGFNVFWPQAEFGTYASSPIPSTAPNTTRSADVLSSNSPLTGYLSAGPSVWEMTDLVTGATTRTAYAAGAFTFPVNKLYRSFGVYSPGTDTSPFMTVGGAY